jgi:hypothetical protein
MLSKCFVYTITELPIGGDEKGFFSVIKFILLSLCYMFKSLVQSSFMRKLSITSLLYHSCLFRVTGNVGGQWLAWTGVGLPSGPVGVRWTKPLLTRGINLPAAPVVVNGRIRGGCSGPCCFIVH